MGISPDGHVLLRLGSVPVNATLIYTWLVMGVLAFVTWRATRPGRIGTPGTRWHTFMEALVEWLEGQIREVTGQEARRYLPFIGTLFLFILLSNVFGLVPGLEAPTASLSTTVALALCVFFAVPVFGIRLRGLRGYLRNYLRPTPLMLPFNIIGEFSRTLALAVRLFGNMMSGALVGAILLGIAPLLFPVFTDALGLLIGVIQAYIFSVLALVYISSASAVHGEGG